MHWYDKIRPLTPTKDSMQAALRARGVDPGRHGVESLKAMLDSLCEEIARGDDAVEVVGELDDAEVTEQLDLHRISTLDLDGTGDEFSAEQQRELLIERIGKLNEWMQLELDLTYPGIDPDSLYADAKKNLADTLHFEMRVSEKIIKQLFMHPLKKKLPDANERIARAVKALRKNTNFKHFTIRYVKGSKRTDIERISLSRAHAKKLMRELSETEERVGDTTGFLREMLDAVVPILVDEGQDRERWSTVLKSYNDTVGIMRKIPDKLPGEEGYEEALKTDADTLQMHGDLMCSALVELCSDKVITNYVHTLQAGHFREMMLLHGYLAYYSNDAVEYVNGEMSVLYHKHGQRGGSCGGPRRRKGWRLTKHVESMALHSARKVLWSSGEADRVLDQHEAGAAERRKRGPEHMTAMRDARQTSGGRSATFASSALEATSARAAKAARHLPNFERTPLREVFNMTSNEICEDDL